MGVQDMHARQESELDRLLGQREHPRNDRLRRDHGGECCERHQRVVHPIRRELVERIFDRGRIGDKQRRLPEIVQHQRRQRHGKPGEADWHASEMPHVGIHRLATGHGEERRAKNGEADVEILVDQEIEGVERAQRGEHRRRLDDAVDTERGQHGEPANHHRPEYLADEAGALLLHDEQADQDDDGDWHHRGRQ